MRSNTKTHEQFLNELKELGAQCEPLDKYQGQSVEIRFKCFRCGNVFTQTPKKLLNILKTCDTPCPACKESASFPEKFVQSVLNQLNIDYIFQLSRSHFEWCGPYRYDFYLKDYNFILEVHGSQHYHQTSFGNLLNNMKNDQDKMDLAINNNVNYMVINAEKSDGDYIKANLIAILGTVIDLSGVDWQKCVIDARKTRFKQICDYYNKNHVTYAEIATVFKVSEVTVSRYIREGFKAGICHKKPIPHNHFKGIPIRCIELDKVFPNIRAANDYLDKPHTSSNIHDCLDGRTKTAYGYHWEKYKNIGWSKDQSF